ncbi:MAG: acetyl/propionyl/methylcrotonyl-CoA carboxylase subunit alpha [Pseudomonadales bacterium]|nr:acetyl/propionyl/methylcrotonyl-CoA carboxylase subunit alpha [Pseudomonadales bacterium]
MSSKPATITKLLIANRGEIACRVMRTAQANGIPCVAVYSSADEHAPHVKMADEAIFIGPAPAKDSYLLPDKIINAAKITGANAIHPGYGFLSENADFAQQCENNNIIFVGPPVAAIKAMGSKSAAKSIMETAAVPLVPGYHGATQTAELLLAESHKIGFPVLLKATAGGGGKGMRIVWKEAEFDEALAAAKREALAGFADDTMLVEKYLTQPRHVEIQVFCDSHNNGVYLFERDCSIQRRHQKVIEEAPAPAFSNELRSAMGDAALKAASAIGYVGAGTVEFLLDIDGSFYFMEMNTRLQVEHPVTELITGQDLVDWQLQVAAGHPLPLQQNELTISGHAIEARIYAEDPDNEFLPATGTIHYLQPPQTSQYIRIDTGIAEGDEISVYYDPMISKLITWDTTREKAIARMQTALSDYHIAGLKTNIPFLKRLVDQPEFGRAELETSFIEKHEQQLFGTKDQRHSKPHYLEHCAILLAIHHYLCLQKSRPYANSRDDASPWNAVDNWQLNQSPSFSCTLVYQEDVYEVNITTNADHPAGFLSATCGDYLLEAKASLADSGLLVSQLTKSQEVEAHQQQYSIHHGHYHRGQTSSSKTDQLTLFRDCDALVFTLQSQDHESFSEAEEGNLTAPMNGTIVTVFVAVDQTVKAGDSLLVLEAMKMEHTIRAPSDGTVKEVYYKAGDLVDEGSELLAFDSTADGDSEGDKE